MYEMKEASSSSSIPVRGHLVVQLSLSSSPRSPPGLFPLSFPSGSWQGHLNSHNSPPCRNDTTLKRDGKTGGMESEDFVVEGKEDERDGNRGSGEEGLVYNDEKIPKMGEVEERKRDLRTDSETEGKKKENKRERWSRFENNGAELLNEEEGENGKRKCEEATTIFQANTQHKQNNFRPIGKSNSLKKKERKGLLIPTRMDFFQYQPPFKCCPNLLPQLLMHSQKTASGNLRMRIEKQRHNRERVVVFVISPRKKEKQQESLGRWGAVGLIQIYLAFLNRLRLC